MRPPRAPRFDDTGSVTAEIATFVVPFLLILAAFAVFAGRATSAVIDVNAAAAAAARAAANTTTPAAARTAASDAAAAMLSDRRWTCTTATDTSAFARGGAITATTTCTVTFADLGLPINATRTVSATATEPVDTYRSWP